MVERDSIHIGAFRGWESKSKDLTVHVVAWNVAEVTRQHDGTNVTVEKPANVTKRTTNVTLPAGGKPEVEIDLPKHYGNPKYVTVWVEGEPNLRWVFRYSASKAAESIPLETRGGLAGWMFIWSVLPLVGTAGGMVQVNKYALRKAVRVPDAALAELVFLAIVSLFFGGFVFYKGTLETLAIAPWSIGVLGGLFIGVLFLFAFGKSENEALALQFTAADANVRPDGSGVWRVPNRTFHVFERDDGTLVAARDGWRAFIARAWPFANVTAEVELDGSPDMMLKGDEESEFGDVFVIDPEAASVIDEELESWSFSVPQLMSWPTDENGDRVPLPSVAWGPLVGVLAASAVVYYSIVGLLQNTALAAVGVACVLLVSVVKPNPGSLSLDLAPFHYGSVLETVIKHRKDTDEVADSEYFQEKYHQERARSNAKRKRDRERTDKTVFAELNDELSGDTRDRDERPDAVPTSTDTEVSADD